MKTRTTPFDLAALKARWMQDPVFKAAFEAGLLDGWRADLLTVLDRRRRLLLFLQYIDELSFDDTAEDDGPRYPEE